MARLERKKSEKKVKARGQFSERYGLLKKEKINKTKKKDDNSGNRGHTIHRYLQGTTRSVSRVLVWGNSNEVAGWEEATARWGGRAARGVKVGVKRNIFQQISHVCLIMYITACGAENQSTTAAVAVAAATAAADVASRFASPRPAQPRRRIKRGETRPVRRNILF